MKQWKFPAVSDLTGGAMAAKAVQTMLLEAGYDPGPVDGVIGKRTLAALSAALGKAKRPEVGAPLAWGAKVSRPFRDAVRATGARLGVDPNHLMAVMAFETGETFSPSIRNAAGSGAVGLIQFMPATAKQTLGTTSGDLAKLDAVAQLPYVERYLGQYRGKMRDVADVYMAVLWPKAIGMPIDGVLWDAGKWPTTYRQNAGLDANKDQRITKREAAGKVVAKLEKGMQPGNVWVQS